MAAQTGKAFDPELACDIGGTHHLDFGKRMLYDRMYDSGCSLHRQRPRKHTPEDDTLYSTHGLYVSGNASGGTESTRSARWGAVPNTETKVPYAGGHSCLETLGLVCNGLQRERSGRQHSHTADGAACSRRSEGPNRYPSFCANPCYADRARRLLNQNPVGCHRPTPSNAPSGPHAHRSLARVILLADLCRHAQCRKRCCNWGGGGAPASGAVSPSGGAGGEDPAPPGSCGRPLRPWCHPGAAARRAARPSQCETTPQSLPSSSMC